MTQQLQSKSRVHRIDRLTLRVALRIIRLQSRLEEAQLCICDCQDVANIDSIDEELRTADMALEAVGAAMVDFLEASRDMDETQRLKDVRKEYVTRFKGLRNQLEELVRQHRCEEVAR